MKRTLAIVLALLMAFCILAACGEKTASTSGTQTSASGEGTASSGGAGTTSQSPASTSSAVTTTADGTRLNYCRYDLGQMDVHPSEDATIKLTWDVGFKGIGQLGNPSDRSYYGGLCFEGLFDWNSIDNCVVPYLAETYEWVDDTTLRIKLYDNITTISGEKLVASDVLWSFKLQIDAGFAASYFSVIDYDKCKVVDELTVDIAVKNPYPFMLLDFCSSNFSIASEKVSKEIAGEEVDILKLAWNPSAGTGPYKLVETDQSTYEKFERREDYWFSAKPYYKYVTITSVEDPNTRSMGIESGDYDEGESMSDAQLAAFQNNPDYTIWANPTAGTQVCLWMNSQKEPMNDVRVRRAIASAIDYETICDVVYAGLAYPCGDSLCNQFMDTYSPVDESKPNYIKYDIENAKALLAEAGYADGFSVDLEVTTGGQCPKVAESLQFMLKEVGITLNINPYDGSTFMSYIRDGQFTIAMSQTGNPNPKSYVNKIDPRIGSKSATGWAGPEWYDGPGGMDYIQELCDKCYYTTDAEQQKAVWKEAQDLCREYVPFIQLLQPCVTNVTRSAVVGLYRQSFGSANYGWFYEADYITG